MQTDPIGYVDSINLYQYCSNNSVNFIDPSGKGLYKWLYTGSWGASDEAYEAAVEAAAAFLLTSSPVVGGYTSVGSPGPVGGTLPGSWTLESGFGVTGRGRIRPSAGHGFLTIESGLGWSQENGFAPTSQFGAGYGGTSIKVDNKGFVKVALNKGIFGFGLIIVPSKFGDLWYAWSEMFTSQQANGRSKGSAPVDIDIGALISQPPITVPDPVDVCQG